MWTLPLFTNLFQLLDPQRPCAMPTYSRSDFSTSLCCSLDSLSVSATFPRREEETTIAANTLVLISEPLDRREQGHAAVRTA